MVKKAVSALIFCVWSYADDLACLAQTQIDSKSYAVRISKEYGTQEEVLERLNERFGGRIHTLTLTQGNDFDVISLGTQSVKNFKLYETLRDSNGDVAFAYDKDNTPIIQKGKLVADFSYLDRFDDIVLIQASTPGSASVSGIVSLTLENDKTIEYAIQEDAVASDVFYDEKGQVYLECAALEV